MYLPFVCPKGQDKLGNCLASYFVELSCIVPSEGTIQTRFLNFDPSRNDKQPPGAKAMYLTELTVVSPREMDTVLLAHEKAAMERPARLAARDVIRRAEEAKFLAEKAKDHARELDDANRKMAGMLVLREKEFNSPKGTQLNCTSQVVPVNLSLNVVQLDCPGIGGTNFSELRKKKWKLLSTERISAQTDVYHENAYGMNQWNGRGVVISTLFEKQ